MEQNTKKQGGGLKTGRGATVFKHAVQTLERKRPKEQQKARLKSSRNGIGQTRNQDAKNICGGQTQQKGVESK